MKKIIMMLMAIMCLFAATGYADGYDPRAEILGRLDGSSWYTEAGKPAFAFIRATNTVIEFVGDRQIVSKVLSAKFGPVAGQPHTDTLRIQNSNGTVSDIEVTLLDRSGATSFLSVNKVGQKKIFSYQNTQIVSHFESVGGVYPGMTKRQVENIYGTPDSYNGSTAVYSKDGWEIDYLYDRVTQIHILKGGTRRLDRSGMNADNSAEEIARAYGVGQGTPMFFIGQQESRIPVGPAEYVWVRDENGKKEVVLSLWAQ